MAKDMKSALTKSLATERQAVEDRFSKAEAIISGGGQRRRQEEHEKLATKPKRPPKRVIRDSFTMPEDDYHLITEIKRQCLKLGIEANKGEIVRAGLKVLARLDGEDLRRAVDAVERVKTGRPKVD